MIYKTNLSFYKSKNKFFYEKVIELEKTVNPVTDWRCDTYNTLDSYSLKNDTLFVDLIERITKEVVGFSKSFGVTSENINCSDAWLNLAHPNSYQEYHTHPNNHFSAVYYVKTPKNSGNIVFRSAESYTDMYPLPSKSFEIPNCKSYWVSPVECDLIIFRSNLSHMVEQNKSSDDRVSIALNFNFY